ncbi:MAG TPA: AAA domain-containing protein, partial [Gemmatimonadaceae bacterium]
YKVVREGIRTSEPAYSIKNLEVFYAPERTEAITSGGDSIVAFERWLVLGDDTLLQQIEDYNAFDCRSTRLCRDWLLSLRHGDVEWFDAKKADAVDAEKEKEREANRRASDARILELRQALVQNVSDADRPWRELLGYLLEYHRREARQEWWEFFKRQDAGVEDLIADTDCIGGLTVDTSVPPRPEKRSKVWTLRFPEQELKLAAGKKAVRADTGEELDIVSLDDRALRLELKVGPSREPLVDGMSLIPTRPIDDTTQREAIVRYAEAVIAGRENEYSAITSIVRRDPPRLGDGVILRPGGQSDLLSGTVDAVGRMDNSHLVIQGPPGTGKTFTSAHAIVELLKSGKRVGVTAMTHKAINNLLSRVEDVARERGVKFTGVKKSSKDPEQQLRGSIIEDTDKNEVATSDRYQLVAGTAWLFSQPELDRKLDCLFVDEAGQVSLASVVSCGVSARNIVLVGDQMQLSQPVKGAHPGGSGVSALDHLMGDWATVPQDRGIFLASTWRMQPDLCRFVSDAFYDGRLESVESAAQQTLIVSNDAGGALAPFGLRFVSVEHEDRAQKSDEEAERLNSMYRALLGQCWVNQRGETKPIGVDDVLVVSPYNMQVNLLKRVLPDGARVGTVDKFQGQEGAVVLISMAASSGEHIPRGIEFLFSRNRLNVAISRARCLSVVLASPQLLGITCRSVQQVRLANVLCWFASR